MPSGRMSRDPPSVSSHATNSDEIGATPSATHGRPVKSWLRSFWRGPARATGPALSSPAKIPETVPGQPLYAVNLSSPELARILDQYWYYRIELGDGLFTGSSDYNNVALTRELLRRLDPRGLDACDIGTMEGLVPILLKRRGARSVLATDGADYTDKVELVKRCYNVSFDYCPHVPLSHLKAVLEDRQRLAGSVNGRPRRRGFDVVVLSGLLYHVFSPLHVLGLARTLLRDGGILILETATWPADEFTQRWMFDGRKWIYPNGTNTWFLSLQLLDHFLRFVRFRPIDCVHSGVYEGVVRTAVAAIAVPDPIARESEKEWFLPSTTNFDYEELVDVHWATPSVAAIPYSPGDNMGPLESPDMIDLHQSVTKLPEWPADPSKMILRLADRE